MRNVNGDRSKTLEIIKMWRRLSEVIVGSIIYMIYDLLRFWSLVVSIMYIIDTKTGFSFSSL